MNNMFTIKIPWFLLLVKECFAGIPSENALARKFTVY